MASLALSAGNLAMACSPLVALSRKYENKALFSISIINKLMALAA